MRIRVGSVPHGRRTLAIAAVILSVAATLVTLSVTEPFARAATPLCSDYDTGLVINWDPPTPVGPAATMDAPVTVSASTPALVYQASNAAIVFQSNADPVSPTVEVDPIPTSPCIDGNGNTVPNGLWPAFSFQHTFDARPDVASPTYQAGAYLCYYPAGTDPTNCRPTAGDPSTSVSINNVIASPSPIPTPSVTPTVTSTPSPTPTPSVTPTFTPTPSVTPTSTATPTTSATPTSPANQGQAKNVYAALGDSYAAGVGSGGTSSGGACLRNSNAYPAVWEASHPTYALNPVACSGATAADVLPQKQLNAITPGTTLITLSAGGNDVGFAGVVAACSVPTKLGDLLCDAANNHARSEISSNQKNGLKVTLSSLYVAIRQKAGAVGAPTAKLVVFGYPDFYQGKGTCGSSDATQQADINRTIDLLDSVIADIASTSTLTAFVDPRPAFAAHALCSQSPWLNGLVRTNNPNPYVTSFHPNQAGQKAYELLLASLTG
jgi:lysophospholipase L1-like esterase